MRFYLKSGVTFSSNYHIGKMSPSSHFLVLKRSRVACFLQCYHRRCSIKKSVRNTLTANYDYSHSNRENLLLQVQVQLSGKPKIFWCILLHFLNLHEVFMYFWSYGLGKTCLLKCIKGFVSENHSVVNVLKILQRRFFPMNIAKFLTTSTLKNISEQLLQNGTQMASY